MSNGANSILSCITGSIRLARLVIVSRESMLMLILILELPRPPPSEREALLMSILALLAEEMDMDILLLDLVAEPLWLLVNDATPFLPEELECD